jgi:hypothetical protein
MKRARRFERAKGLLNLWESSGYSARKPISKPLFVRDGGVAFAHPNLERATA